MPTLLSKIKYISSSIAINKDGYPSSSYSEDDPEQVKFAYKDENGWHTTMVKEAKDIQYTRILLGNGQNIVIGFPKEYLLILVILIPLQD